MIFIDKYYDSNIIEEKTNEELTIFLKENNIGFEIVDNPTRWCAFAQYYAHKNGFNLIKATSFSYIISVFYADMGVSAGTDAYYREDTIENVIVDHLHEYPVTDESSAISLFNYIFDLYDNHITEYEYKSENLNIRLTPSELELFKTIDGGNYSEKFRNLLKKI